VITDQLTVEQFREAMGVTRRTVTRWVADGLVRAERDGRHVFIPRSELERLAAGRLAAEQRAAAAAGAVGVLQGEWRAGYVRSVRDLADAGRALGQHTLDEGPEHRPDQCAVCAALLDRIVTGTDAAHDYARIAVVADRLAALVRTAGQDADRVGAALRRDDPEPGEALEAARTEN